ncbi:MAG: flavodoxin family protein [Chloroflexi bacterium]|nr:flavodoxin family protein [Chloroflexota bacterium]
MNFEKTDALKVLAIAGSPRRNGNTDLLLARAIEGATSEKIEVVKIVLTEMCIAPCRHCDGCLPTGRCVVEDDQQNVHQLLRAANRIILASPIFFMGLTAQTKAMIDRCQALWVLKYVLKLPVPYDSKIKRKGLFLSVGGTGFTKLFEPALETVKVFFRVLECEMEPPVVFRRIDEKGDILKHPTALQEAFEAGRRLV